MTDEEEFAARSQLKWAREGDAWILLYRKYSKFHVAHSSVPDAARSRPVQSRHPIGVRIIVMNECTIRETQRRPFPLRPCSAALLSLA
jgi:hypothetical protein